MVAVFRLLGLVASLAAAATPMGQFRGERLSYDVMWGGMVVGHARIETLPTTSSHLMVVRTTAKANKTIQSLYPVRDTIESFFDTATGLPLEFRKRQLEGSYEAEFKIGFDRVRQLANVSGSAKGKPRPDTALRLEGGEFDLLSAFLWTRRNEMEPGKSLWFPMVDNRKRFASVEVACLKRETIEMDSGKVRAILIEPRIHGDALFASKGKLYIWLTDDAQRVPVRMKSKIKLGTIQADLVSRVPPR